MSKRVLFAFFVLLPLAEIASDDLARRLRERGAVVDEVAAYTTRLAAPDPAVHQLLYGLQAMAHDYCLSRPLMDLLTPGMLDAPGAIEEVGERLVDWGLALVEHERRRRGLTT